ncbi:WSC domain-containing protein [Mycena sanguinolenta]|nr:WSC domain-containing protein [Mycena sanguinolenta]
MPAYRLAIVFALAQLGFALTSPSTVLEYKEWKFLQCQADSTSGRALHHLVPVSSSNVTVESCLDACAAGGFILGGVEFGEECYCGNALLYVYGTSEACDMPCSGNASEFCGGPDALNLYQFADTPFTTGPPSPVFRYKNWGWWACINQVSIPHRPLVSIPAEQMTVEKCLDGCEAAGYNAAALQDGQNCHCNLVDASGDGPDSWESVSNGECFEPCLANATEICGGLLENESLGIQGQLSGYVSCDAFPNTGNCRPPGTE